MKNLEVKEEIRLETLKKRQAISPDVWQSSTEIIAKEITAHDWFREATDIYCYLDCKGEVGTRQIIEEAWRLGKSVWAPQVDKTALKFIALHSFEELAKGRFGLLEPKGEEAADGVDGLVIVPGVAFDVSRARIGYGKGYYDRYLKEHPKLHTIAAAFDVQVLDEIPQEDNDIKPQILITETRTIKEH